MNEQVDIGKIIRTQLKNEGRSISWLAKQVHQDASNFCRKLQKTSIDTNLLLQISKVMNYDFFNCYSCVLEKDNKKMNII